MPKLTENALLLGGVGLVLANRVLIRAGLRKPCDGWRRAAGIVLRGEESTFYLSAFGLHVWSDNQPNESRSIGDSCRHFAERLASFLAMENECHLCVANTPDADIATRCDGPSYTLRFDEWVEGAARFVRPAEWKGEDRWTRRSRSTSELMNVVVRINSTGAADVWFRINHVASDGVPMQETLSRMEKDFGLREEFTFPTPEAFETFEGPRSVAGREGIAEMQAFADFTPLLDWRKKQNAKLPQPMTVSAALMWCLGGHPTFKDLRMGTTVEVAAKDGLARGVGVVVVQPSEHFADPEGLAKYVSVLNRGIELNRVRESDGCKTLDAAALIPPRMANVLLRKALDGGKAFGSIVFTVLRDAKVFGAPIAVTGHPDGFLAIGSIALDAGNGRKVGCVTMRGPENRVRDYPQAIREAIGKL